MAGHDSDMGDPQGAQPSPSLFKPPLMSNKQATSLRKQAIHLAALAEDEGVGANTQACARLSLDDSSSSGGAAGGASARCHVTIASWDSYWDRRQSIDVPGR
jgi:hypothetical protein